MRTLIDVSLAKPASSDRQLGPVLAGVRAAAGKSEELIEALLTLARSDRGLGHTAMVDLPTAVEDAIDLMSPVAAARQVRIDTALQHAQVAGDRVLLTGAVLLPADSAISAPATTLRVRVMSAVLRYGTVGQWLVSAAGHR